MSRGELCIQEISSAANTCLKKATDPEETGQCITASWNEGWTAFASHLQLSAGMSSSKAAGMSRCPAEQWTVCAARQSSRSMPSMSYVNVTQAVCTCHLPAHMHVQIEHKLQGPESQDLMMARQILRADLPPCQGMKEAVHALNMLRSTTWHRQM